MAANLPHDPVSKAIPDPRRTSSLEERLQLLIEAVTDYGIFVLDPDGHVVSWNSGAQKIKGYTRDEIVGKHFSTFYPPEDVERGWPQEELRRALASGRFWANVVITPLYEAGGELAGFAKITRDLTDRRAQEERLRTSEERLRLLVE